MDIDDYADEIDAKIANLAAYAAQIGDKEMIALVDDLNESWGSLDSFLDEAVVFEMDEGTEH